MAKNIAEVCHHFEERDPIDSEQAKQITHVDQTKIGPFLYGVSSVISPSSKWQDCVNTFAIHDSYQE